MAETNALNDMVSLKPYPNVSAFLSGTKQAPTPKGYIGEPEIAPAQQELRQAKSKAREDIGKADINIEKAKREEEASKMQVDVDVEKEFAERREILPERLALKERQKEANALKFMPTQDTAKDIASLFSLVGIISMALGGGGRMSGQLALGNMNAMMEGYRKGRTDLNKKEAVEFDKNFKAMQASLETLSKEYKDALEIEKSDKERGRLERHMTLAKAGSPVLKAMEERLGPAGTYEFIKDLEKDAETTKTTHNSLQKYADDRQAKKEQAQQAADLRRDLATIKATGSGAGALPKDKETNNEHRFRYSAINNLQEVLDELKKPEVRKLIGPQNQFTPDVILNLQKGYPELAQKLARFQSEEFKIGGKALTASEQRILGPIYNWRGLTSQALEDNLKEAVRAMDKEQMYLENRYPGLAQFDYGVKTTPAAPSQQKATPDEIKAYADEHFKGNQDAAKADLKAKGFL